MISEKAKNYADGKVLEALTAAVENAYTDGYKAGYNDAVEKLNNGAQELESDGITYVDLGLPSGTLWASDYLRDKDGKLVRLKYDEAAPLALPKKEQFEELKRYCEVSLNLTAKKDVSDEIVYDFSRNGKKITLTSSSFWTFTPSAYEPSGKAHLAVTNLLIEDCSKGYARRVRLVKNK